MSSAITVTLYGKKTTDISDNLVSMHVEYELNRIPTAEFIVSDGNFADRTYPLFDSPDLQIGAVLNIQIRYESTGEKDASIFQGVVTSSCFGIQKGLPILTVRVMDPAFRLIQAVKTELFNNVTDKIMIEKVLSGATGVSLKKTAASLTTVTYDQFVRNQTSAWDFVRARAGAFGLVIQLENGAISILKVDETTGSKSVELGITEIIGIDIIQNAEDLTKVVEISYWDVKKNASASVKKTTFPKIADAVMAPAATYTLLSLTDKKEAEGVQTYFTTKETRESMYGSITVPGDSSWKLMQKLTLKSFPKAYNGDHAVSRVVQELKYGVWTTKVGIGRSSFYNYLPNSVEDPTLPSDTEMQFATAMKWEKDPSGLGRIPVKVLAFGTGKYWVFPSQVGAGTKQSSYLLPEENEQVLIGFLNGNYNQGFVMTSTYLGNNKPPAPFKLDAKTPVGFLSTSGMKLVFDDSKTDLELSTSSSNMQAMTKNGGVEVKTNKDFKVTASGKVEVKASSKMTLKGASIDLN